MRPSRRRLHLIRTSRLEWVEPRLLTTANSPELPSLDYDVAGQNASAVLSTLAETSDLTGLSSARASYGFDGAGQTVVVIDTGIAYRHTALGGSLGTGSHVVGGYDFAERDTDPYDDGAAGSHGTHVAGIIASRDPTRPGVAPGVDLVSLRVFDDSGAGSYQWVEEALQWVHANRSAFANPITTVNLSLGNTWNGSTPPDWSTLEDELATLEADGIFTAVAAGNSFSSYGEPGLSYPAASSHVVPVASVDNDGALSYYSQRSDRVIAAPGRSILSTVPDYVGNRNGVDDDFARFSGTSMAAPYVAAASTLLRQAYQFVGVSGVTQATLYNLMRNTADTIHDAQTNQDYLRLNVQRALDAIMPADDYGSTAESACQLGTIADSRSLSGAVARQGDHDFFTFTAGRTGQLTLSLDVTGNLQSHWDVVAGSSSTQHSGNTLSLQVVAGQTYTIGLGTTTGLGHYTLNAQLSAAPEADRSGGRQENLLDRQISNDGQWITFTAGQQGLLTFEAFFANAQGDVDMELFDANRQFLQGSYSWDDSERIDVTAAAGQTFYLHVYVNEPLVNGDVDLRITNLLSQIGDQVNVLGTQGNDQFSFTAGSTHHLTINGVAYDFSASQVRRVTFSGLAGSDTATLTGSSGDDSAVLRAGSGVVTGNGYELRVGQVENIQVGGGGGRDVAALYDSAGDDTLVASPREARLSGQGFFNQVTGFEFIHGYATAGGNDTAWLYDSPGDDALVGTPLYTKLSGSGFFLRTKFFDTVCAYATAGGADSAALYDSAGNDTFIGKPTESSLSGARFQIQVKSFDFVHAYATAGGQDEAHLYDSPGNDVFVRRNDFSKLYGSGFFLRAKQFEKVQAVSGAGGQDVAYLFDSVLADHFQASGNTAQLINAAQTLWISGFDQLRSFGGKKDTHQVAAVDCIIELRGY
jgi:subtilisin family serine protease